MFPLPAYWVVIQLCILVLVERASLRCVSIPRVSVPSRRVVSVVRLLWVKVSAVYILFIVVIKGVLNPLVSVLWFPWEKKTRHPL